MGITVFCFTLWCSLTVARMQDLPAWRRYLPLCFYLVSLGASLLRAFDVPEVANVIAFPLNFVVIILSLREIRLRQGRHRAGLSTG
ncbi:hypothetical protein ABZ890_43805 [Streptomyces sp. NPDC046984]|uniref:hypothetical protein n=1 Tax=Streptomyces sp. NPDC046984 TaxID=3155138 RepID=UPI0033D37283